MNHKTDMREALQLCIDAMLHDGVPTDPEHPKRIALDAAEAALASRSDAQADERGAVEIFSKLHKFLNAAGAEGLVLDGIDGGDLFMSIFDADGNVSDRVFSSKVRALAFQELFEFQEATGFDTAEEYRAAAPQAEAAQGVPQGVIDALRFYAHGHHYNIDDDHQQFDTVSGEPPNWLHSERDDDCTMIEDGSIARAALCGGVLGWEEPTQPVEGEVLRAAPSPDREQVREDSRRVDELSMLIRQLVHALRKAAPDNDLAGRAGDYLKRAGLQGSPLRVEAPDAPPSRECGEPPAPVSEPEQPPAENAAVRNKIAAALHYPDHWDTAAYPTLDDAAWEAIAAAKLTCSECGEWQSFPERDATKTNAEQGLYRKFEVRRVDGSDATGGKHDGCEYFVLDMTHDAHAPAALRAYAQACASTHPHLSADLMVRFGGERQGAALSEASVRQIAHRFGVLYDDRVTFYGDTLTDFIRAILAASAPTLGEQPQAAEPKGQEEQPSFTNPLTPYGMLVRALRIVTGTTLYDMAKALLTTPAKLSSMEFGRIPVAQEFTFDVSAYFDALGVPDTLAALKVAANARALLANGE